MTLMIYILRNIPVEQVKSIHPSGHAVHMFLSLIVQAVHVPPQAIKITRISNKNGCTKVYSMWYTHFAQVGPENPSGHAVHIFSSKKSQAVHVPPQAEKDHIIIIWFTNMCRQYVVPVAQVGPENPSGHAVHKFSSWTSQAVHVPPQAEK